MRKNIFFLCIGLTIISCVHAQNAPSNVIATQGGFSKSDNVSLEWTVGETITSTYIANSIYTQGFNQSFMAVSRTNDKNSIGAYSVLAAPNPVNSILNVYIKAASTGSFSVVLTDMRGLRIFQKHPAAESQTLRINMRPLAAGIYLLQVFDANNAVVNTTKIVKF